VAGKIAVVDRGVCSFTTKVRNAENAGAIGVLVVNNVAGDPIAMAQDGTTPVPTIPAVMVSKSDGAIIKGSALLTSTISVDGRMPVEVFSSNADILAGFSSRGPAPFTYLIKPEVTAPGVNVVSSIFDGKFAFFQGTSMATPHVAGAAALLKQLHPDWTPADIKSALITTAKRPVWDYATANHDSGVMDRGGGRIDLGTATGVPLTFDPATVSFGLWRGSTAADGEVVVAVRNVTSSTHSCTVSVTGTAPIVAAVANSVSLAPGESTWLVLKLQAGKATPSGQYSGDVEVSCGSASLRLPWWVGIDRKAKP
jgi:minor extracellular serine protease Vpr